MTTNVELKPYLIESLGETVKSLLDVGVSEKEIKDEVEDAMGVFDVISLSHCDEVYNFAEGVFGSKTTACQWFYQRDLSRGLTPYEICLKGGKDEVIDHLRRMDEGYI